MFSFFLLLLFVSLSKSPPPTGENEEIPEGYKNLREITNEMFRISSIYHKSITLIDFSEEYGLWTYEGRSIYGLKITSQEAATTFHKPKILVISGHHSNELLPPEVILRMAELLGKSSPESEFGNILSKYVIYMIPLLNVDGYNHVFEEEPTWRKNRRPLPDDNIGVDLNRNYDIGWEFVDLKYNKTVCLGENDILEINDPNQRVFRGKAPFSEVETEIVKRMMEEYRFSKVLDLHSYGRFVFFGMKDCYPLSQPKSEVLKSMVDELANSAEYSSIFPWDYFYSYIGDMSMYHYQKYSDCSFTAETALEFQPSLELSEEKEIPDIINLITKFFNLQIPVIGRLTARKIPLSNINLSVIQIPHLYGEIRRTDKEGYFYMYIPSGEEFTLQFEYNGEPRNYSVFYDGQTQTLLEIDVEKKTFFEEKIVDANIFIKICAVVSSISIFFVIYCFFYRIFLACCCFPSKKEMMRKKIEEEMSRYSSSSNTSYELSSSNGSWSDPIDYVTDGFSSEN